MSQYVPGTTPYPWPYDGDLASRGTALLVLAGTGASQPPGQVVAAVRSLANAARRSGSPIILVANVEPGRGQGITRSPADSTIGPSLLGDLQPDQVVAAGGIDAFYASDLALILRTRGIQRLLLAGCGLETTVHSTMRDANDRGYECLLVVDACAADEPALVPAAISMVEMSGGIFGAVGRTSAVIRALANASPTAPAAPTIPAAPTAPASPTAPAAPAAPAALPTALQGEPT